MGVEWPSVAVSGRQWPSGQGVSWLKGLVLSGSGFIPVPATALVSLINKTLSEICPK